MSFDTLAPHYRWMEWLLAGEKLQRCRTAFLEDIETPRRALLLGEGNARFLLPFLRRFPEIEITCVDASDEMLRQTRRRLQKAGVPSENISFARADILEWRTPPEKFDLIVSHFFLDCFPPETLRVVVRKISDTAAPDSRWLLADFREPESGFGRWRARLILASMYFFFRRVTAIRARAVTAPDSLLAENGFTLEKRTFAEWGLLHSDLWARNKGMSGGANVPAGR